MSMFDTSCICLACAWEERERPDYRRAADAELAEVRKGNYNFKGIGYVSVHSAPHCHFWSTREVILSCETRAGVIIRRRAVFSRRVA